MSPSKQIVIIGGGISGLATLHYLSQKYQNQPEVKITLLEKNNACGGNIKTEFKDDCYFETGPNGFLNNKPRTLEFINQLNLTHQLVTPSKEAEIRYICYQDKLHIVPTDPASFFKTKLLTMADRGRLLMDYFIAKGNNPDETIYDFGHRRFGEKFTNLMLDSMVTGIHAGDIKKINLKAAFPRIYELEQTYGSLFKALIEIKKQRKSETVSVLPKGTLCSFQKGMGELIKTIANKYINNILLNQEVQLIKKANNQFLIVTKDAQLKADVLILSSPAYQLSQMVKEFNQELSVQLNQIDYAPVIVVGLVYARSIFKTLPKGFGYLIPSCEQKKVLGVLFENNIFPNRCNRNQIYFRLMLGGSCNRNIFNQSQEDWIKLAVEEINNRFKLTSASPEHVFLSSYLKGIPQYDLALVKANKSIDQVLSKEKSLYIVSNFRGGVALNDCIENAYQCSLNI